jgi:hypothetical protein
VGCSAPRSPIHEVDAVLAGGRATATTNSCTGNRDKAPRKCSQFLELIGSVAVAVPADYTRYMNQPCVYMEKVGETVKFGWERHPRRGTVGPPQESEMVDPSRCTITCSPLENASTFSESIRPTLALRTPRSIEQAEKIAELAQPTAFQRRERRNARSDGGP